MNPDAPRPVASVTKVMTILLTLEMLDAGHVRASDVVTISMRREGSHQEQHPPAQHFSFQSRHASGHHWLSNIFMYLFNSSLLNVLERAMATHSSTLAWSSQEIPWELK